MIATIIAMTSRPRMLPTTTGSSGTPEPLLPRTGGRRADLPLPEPAAAFARALFAISGLRRPDGPQIGAGDRQVAGQGAETKEGVALGGAHRSMRDDAAPGPLTHVSAS